MSTRGVQAQDLSQILGAEPKDSMRGWSLALEEAKLPGLTARDLSLFRRTMASRYELLRQEGLLQHQVITVCAAEFMKNPEAYLSRISAEKLFPFIEPKNYDASLPRWHNCPCQKSEIIDIIKRVVGDRALDSYVVTLQAAYDILYTANVIVRSNGDVFAEFAKGSQIPSRQGVTLAFRIEKDKFLDILRYSGADPTQQSIGAFTLKHIPHYGSGRERTYQRGYYELALGRDENQRMKALFFDYRTDKFFVGD